MNGIHQYRTGVAVLRPWPFGPPLRGRAPHRDAGTQASPTHALYDSVGTTSASAPVGDLASPPPMDSVL